MKYGPGTVLSSGEIDAIRLEVIAEAEVGREQAAWLKLQPLRRRKLSNAKLPWTSEARRVGKGGRQA